MNGDGVLFVSYLVTGTRTPLIVNPSCVIELSPLVSNHWCVINLYPLEFKPLVCYRAAPLVVNASFVIYAVWRGTALATLCKNLWTIMEMLGLLHGIMQFEECVRVEVARNVTA